MFFVKNIDSNDVSHMYYYSDGNNDLTHNGIILLSNPTTGNNEYEQLTDSLDLSRYNKIE